MSKFKGTPGPWQVRKWSGDEWPDRRISVGPESDGIATAVCISPRYCSETKAEANARLIAAAPELLEALESLIKGYVSLLEAGMDRITSLGGDCDPVPVMEQNDPWLRDARAAIAKATGEAQ